MLAAGAWWWQARPGYEVEAGFAVVEYAFRSRQSSMAEVTGTVARILVDRDDPRDQRYIIRLPNDQSVLVVHDQKAGGHVPVSVGDTVWFAANTCGRKPAARCATRKRDFSPRRLHGWIDHKGDRYQ